jgi:UDP-glucuronate decarboxylase
MGGAGFLGSHLCEALIARDVEVVALDNLQTGSRESLRALLGHRRFSFVEHDVTTPFHLPVDRIFNLACPASPRHYQASPMHTTLTSVLGTVHGVELARAHGARFCLASTSEVYGDPEVHPQVETYHGNVNPIGVRACYDEGKRCAETIASDAVRTMGVDVRIARIFNTYGPRMAAEDGRVVSNFIVQALRGEDITVYGDGLQTRSFCFVSDMIDAFLRLMDHPRHLGPVNLGNPVECTVVDLALLVVELCRSKSRVRLMPLPEDDPKVRRPDIDLARRELGFEPKVTLREGLLRTIEHFRHVEGAEPAMAPVSKPVAIGAAVKSARRLNGGSARH